MTYQLQKQATPAANVQRIISAQIDDLLIELTENPDKHDAIHKSRKLCKRIRATLRLVRDSIGEDAFKAANLFFRDMSREMSSVRDSYVLVKTLNGLEGEISAESYQTLLTHLQAEHERISDELLAQRDVTAEVAEQVRTKRADLELLSFTETDINAFLGLRRVYKRGYNGLRHAVESQQDAHIHHDWRKRVKYFWHHCEMLEPLWPPLFTDFAVELHLLSDFLGNAHDLFVLREEIDNHPDWLSDAERIQLDALLTAREHDFYERAYPVGKRLFGLSQDGMWQWVKSIWDSWREISAETTQTLTQEILSDRFLSVTDAAVMLNVPIRQLRAELRDKQRAGYKIGGRWVLDRTEL